MAARPSVVSIERSEPFPEVVTQEQLRILALGQRAAWSASKRAAQLSEEIEAALQRGARIEPGKLKFDRVYELVPDWGIE